MKISILCGLLVACAAAGSTPKNLGNAGFYRPPQLTLMVGFIKDPQQTEFTDSEWAKNIGANFDAERLAERCKQDGIAQIIWYDKWIDGLVFHNTKTTTFHTSRDFLADLAPACRKRGIKLVIYFNTYYDGNPEFAKWACTDRRGKPIAFSSFWPLNLLSMYSPFRQKALEQIRELFVDYNVDGLWLDVPSFARISYDPWTREAFRKEYGKDMEDASADERERFSIASSVRWNRDVAAFVRKLKPSATVTTNAVIDPIGNGPAWAAGMGEPLDYFSTELHTIRLQREMAPLLGEIDKPYEAGTLLSEDWFAPLHSGPLGTAKSPDEMRVELATVLSSGLNMYLAVSPGHDGTLDQPTMNLVDLAGGWLRAHRPWLENAEDFTDVAIFLGTADPKDLAWPGGGPGYEDEIAKLESSLRASGYFPHRFIDCTGSRHYDAIPDSVDAVIVPDRAQLTAADADLLHHFTQRGGRILAIGRGVGLGTGADPHRANSIFGVRSAGYAMPASLSSFEIQWKSAPIGVHAPVLGINPASAETLLWGYAQRVGSIPILTHARFGNGAAYSFASTESALASKPELLQYVWKQVIGDPVWRFADGTSRYVVRLSRQNGRYILHVIDSLNTDEGPMSQAYDTPRYRPLPAKLQINSRILPFQTATVEPDHRPLSVSANGEWKTIEVFADPELTIVLE